jgi:hypothetical protein
MAWEIGDVSASETLTDSDHLYAKHINEQRQSHSASAVVGTTPDCQFYCDGVKDEVQIQAAIDSLGATGGKVIIRKGTYILEDTSVFALSNIGMIYAEYGVTIQGEGTSSTILKIKDGAALSTGTIMFRLGINDSTGDFVFRDLTLDGNGANQDFSESGAWAFLGGIFGMSMAGSIHQMLRSLILDNVVFKNFVMGDTGSYLNGMPINTYGCLFFQASNCTVENTDYGYFLTSFYPGISPNYFTLTNIIIKNPKRAGIVLEGINHTSMENIIIYSDEQVTATGIQVYTASDIPDIHAIQLSLNNITFENIGLLLDIGQGGSGQHVIRNSCFTNLSAYNCLGYYWFKNVDSSSIFSNINAYNCAQGGISGVENSASIRIGPIGTGASTDHVLLNNICIVDSGSYALKCDFQTYILGGSIVNSTSGVILDDTYLDTKEVVGYSWV